MPRKLTSLSGIDAIDPVDQIERRIDALVTIYAGRQAKLESLLGRVSLTDFQRFRANELLSQVRQEVAFLNQRAKDFAARTTPLAYRNGWNIGQQSARELGIASASVSYGNLGNRRSVSVLVDQIVQDATAANRSILTGFTRYVRATQQSVLQETAINRQLAEGVVEGATRRQTSDALLRSLREQMGESKFITAGTRKFDPKYYAELLTRTRMREAASQGTVNAAIQYGMDLVQIDVHGDACPVCRTRMGRVYSISGGHPDFPVLDAKPPLHVNCRCTLFGVTEEYLESKTDYAAIVDLSNGPRFLNPREAQKWLDANPEKNIATLKDLNAFVKRRKAAA